MRNDFVIVSSLFDIRRELIDGRSWDDYLSWFDVTLKLRCPMVLFVSEETVPFIEERRIGLPTTIIPQTIEEAPYHYLKGQIDEIVSSDEYRSKIRDPGRIECLNSLYSVIQYSKFKWLEQVSKVNPFNSKFFFWLDAGGSRFFDGYDLSQDYPSDYGLNALNSIGDKFLIQMNMESYSDLANTSALTKDYLLDNRSYVLGSMFGGTENIVAEVAREIDNLFINDMLQNNFINNEQIALGYLLKRNPSTFAAYQRYNNKHMALFNEIGKR